MMLCGIQVIEHTMNKTGICREAAIAGMVQVMVLMAFWLMTNQQKRQALLVTTHGTRPGCTAPFITMLT